MSTKIFLSSPHMSGFEQKYVQEAFESNWIAPLGANVDEFEHELAMYLEGNKYAVALNSGTSALHLSLILANVNEDDTVLCQSFTFVASANPIVYLGATPIFIDSENDTWNMCPHLLEKAIKEQLIKGLKPKAMVINHSYGMPSKMETILQIAKHYQIVVIEDSASALGSSCKNQKCGTFGDFGILSFNGNKIITTSGGGALISKDAATKEKAIFLATQAGDNAPHYQHSEIGYNYRMSNVVAGIGRGQMEVLKNRIEKRRANFLFYKEALAEISEIEFLREPQGLYSNRWLTCILVPSFEIREKIRQGLAEENIEARPLWKPMHQQPVFEQYPAYVNGISDDLFERGLCLPSGSNLCEEDLIRVVQCVKKQYF